MKTVLIFLIALGLQTGHVVAGTLTDPETPNTMKRSWTKSEKGIWQGGYMAWYKYDAKSNEVKFSSNRRKWKTAPDAAWQDKQGNWLFIYEGKLMTNANGTWTAVSDKTWQDLNGNWYRFNDNWQLEETSAQLVQN